MNVAEKRELIQYITSTLREFKEAERARLERIIARHSRHAHSRGRDDLALMLDRLGDAITACGDDGSAPLTLICPKCCADRGTTPSDQVVPVCYVCGTQMVVGTSEDL